MGRTAATYPGNGPTGKAQPFHSYPTGKGPANELTGLDWAGAVVAPVVPPPFVPTALAGLQLWLRADMGVLLPPDVPSIAWHDQANGFWLNPPATAPTLNPTGLGGKPAVNFTGPSGLLCTSGNPVAGASARTLFVVYVVSAYSVTLLCMRTSAEETDYLAGHAGVGGGLICTSSGGQANANLVDGDNVLGVGRINEWSMAGAGTPLVFRMNGVLRTLTQSPLGSTTETGTAGFSLGRAGQSYGNFVGEISEVILYDSQLSAANATLVRNYLKARYGL